ncbi:uncharacterized protein LOC123562570 isoform X2 [Mercenaria mercenaria]|uniref:uncharacterized protein LOC123562570 isoform X2 n=1 Tax=Mercenaria mercenaria TaxID=6596 RepID=UPI00234E4806|nr:uncharacterized protein LOC123562570 isoform X2 [Mercenaria mercenaria]
MRFLRFPRRSYRWFKEKQRDCIVLCGISAAIYVFLLLNQEVKISYLKGYNGRKPIYYLNVANFNNNNNRWKTPGFLGASYQRLYDLATSVRNKCGHTSSKTRAVKVETYSSKSEKVKLCAVWKVGTTFFKRLFMINTLPEYKDIVNPFNISFHVMYGSKQLVVPNSDDVQRFLFVRDPYHRLLSGYIDKLLAPNPVYWKILGVPAIRFAREKPDNKSLSCGHDLTFREYVKYVAASMTSRKKVNRDMHFDSFTALCKPCQISYDFVGKLENIKTDAVALMKSLNLSSTIEFLAHHGSELVTDDAIRDTTYQPFDPEFVPLVKKCLNRMEVFQRSWSKLKMRGLIGNYNLTIDFSTGGNLTYSDFLDMARNAYRKSTAEERKELQHSSFLNMFSTVDKDDMETISKAYAEDFILFDYEARPTELFKI